MNAPRLRILVVHNRYRSDQPSGENQVVDQEIELLTRAGHEVALFERRSDDIASMPLRSKVAVPLQVPWNGQVRRQLAERLQADRPDIVHIHNTFPLLSPSTLAACANARTPVVATLHNYLQVCPAGTLFRDGKVCTDCARGLALASIRHGCYRNSPIATAPRTANMMLNRRRWWSGIARFFCVSDSQRRILVQAGMPAHLLSVKHNFVVDPGVRRTGPGKHVLFVGRMTEEKGLSALMTAWDQLAATDAVSAPLVLAGAGPMEREIAGWARDRDDVRYLGLQTSAQCRALMAHAVALVAPAAWLEPLSMVVVEALAAGVPVVAPAFGASLELVRDGVTGIHYRPSEPASLAESVRRIASDIGLNRAMGHAARRYYEQAFTPAVGLEALVSGYEVAISGERSREPA